MLGPSRGNVPLQPERRARAIIPGNTDYNPAIRNSKMHLGRREKGLRDF